VLELQQCKKCFREERELLEEVQKDEYMKIKEPATSMGIQYLLSMTCKCMMVNDGEAKKQKRTKILGYL